MNLRKKIALSLIIGGILLCLLPTAIIYFSDAYKAHLQKEEAEEWIRKEELKKSETESTKTTLVSESSKIEDEEDSESPKVEDKEPLVIFPGSEGYLLEIPKIDLSLVIRELESEAFSGKNTPMLKKYGVGQVPYTEYLKNVSPGDDGTTAITGHRTTSGAPFRHLDLLEPGDEIIISQGEIKQKWEVIYTRIVLPSQIDAIRSVSGIRRLVLLACNPPGSDRERIIVYARLLEEVS
jgi:sortase A